MGDDALDVTLAWAASTLTHAPRRVLEEDHSDVPVKGLLELAKETLLSGEGLSHMSLPVGVNIPLSNLQFICWGIEQSMLLDQAAQASSTCERFKALAMFAISMYSPFAYIQGRKPFNPLLGETFEFVDIERKFRFYAEQVNHHPPVSVALAEGESWSLHEVVIGQVSGRPKSLRMKPSGTVTVTLLPDGDKYSWEPVETLVKDAGTEQCTVYHEGTMTIQKYGSTDHCNISFHKHTFLRSQHDHEVVVTLWNGDDEQGTVLLEGHWNASLVDDQGHVVWKLNAPSQDAIQSGFGLTEFACGLNEPCHEAETASSASGDATAHTKGQIQGRDEQAGNDDGRSGIARVANNPLGTDSRFRPDQRLYELGQYDEADGCKKALEIAQRDRAEKGIAATPQLFEEAGVDEGSPEWTPRFSDYWKQRRKGTLKSLCRVVDIYSCDVP
eukprot:m.354113 g.354113  ORF g.354113 m.354113 type:complete len:442 (+) comp16921_c0_seq1:31-1356(+)